MPVGQGRQGPGHSEEKIELNRINAGFRKLRRLRRKALVTFITAGDPDMNTTARLVEALEESGADVVDSGVLAEEDKDAAVAFEFFFDGLEVDGFGHKFPMEI